MRILVTGVAGFIGSHLGEALLRANHQVIGIDNFSNYYSKKIKKKNLINLQKNNNFTFIEDDLAYFDLSKVGRIDIVFHESAQPGVRDSWGNNFDNYIKDNILVTQRLLEFFKNQKIHKFIFASSSSVYGDSETYPTREDIPLYPISPYGVSKLAAEKLCYLYYRNYQIPVTMLRYFTVYGSRQRPDMFFNRAIQAAITGSKLTIFGDGKQLRDFTHIKDIIQANLACLENNVEGQVINIGGGSITSINNAVEIIENISGKQIDKSLGLKEKGDVLITSADLKKAKKILNYIPTVKLYEGLCEQVTWQKNITNYEN